MEYIVGTQRCRYGWQTLFPVAIPKSEDAVSSATLDLSENWGAVSGRVTPPAVSVNSIQMIQFHTHDTFVPCTLTKYFSPVIICSVGVIVRLIQQKWELYLWEVCVRTSQTHRLGEGCDLLITIFVWKDLSFKGPLLLLVHCEGHQDSVTPLGWAVDDTLWNQNCGNVVSAEKQHSVCLLPKAHTLHTQSMLTCWYLWAEGNSHSIRKCCSSWGVEMM